MSDTIQNPFNALVGTPQQKPLSSQVHRVPWGKKAFPKDGSGVTLKVAPGDQIQFNPIDDSSHNVAEAVLEKDSKETCGYRWSRNSKPRLNCNFKTRRGFNEVLNIDREGTYHLVCPIDKNHETMRLTVLASANPAVNQMFEEAKRVDQTRQPAAARNPFAALGQAAAGPQNPFAALGQVTAPFAPQVAAPLVAATAVETARKPASFNIFSPYFVLGPLGPVIGNTRKPRTAQGAEFQQNLQQNIDRVEQVPAQVQTRAEDAAAQVQTRLQDATARVQSAQTQAQTRVQSAQTQAQTRAQDDVTSILNGI